MWILIRWVHQKPADLDLRYVLEKIISQCAEQGFISIHKILEETLQS